MTDLDRLIEAVEAGALPGDATGADYGLPPALTGSPTMMTIYAAFSGSLDAALALHDALLPGWDWGVWNGEAMVSSADAEDHFGEASNPARAWLLCILRAKAAQE